MLWSLRRLGYVLQFIIPIAAPAGIVIAALQMAGEAAEAPQVLAVFVGALTFGLLVASALLTVLRADVRRSRTVSLGETALCVVVIGLIVRDFIICNQGLEIPATRAPLPIAVVAVAMVLVAAVMFVVRRRSPVSDQLRGPA